MYRARPALQMAIAACKYAGMTIAPSTIAVQQAAFCGAKNHAPANSATEADSVRLRRRLSAIFQREMADKELGTILPWRSGTREKSQRSTCQSPRIQRCLRRLNALIVDG